MAGDLNSRFEEALKRGVTTTMRAQFGRALVLVRNGLVSRRACERWFEEGARADLGRWLLDRGHIDEAVLERELLCRANEPAAEPSDLAAAQRLPSNVYGSVVRLQKIGESATGMLWRAWDTKRRRLVALRTLRPEAWKFAESARVAMGLVLPNVIGVGEVARREGEAYVVSDYVPGTNLRGWTMNHAREVGTLLSMMRSVARALHRAHDRGCLHLALKPENVIVAAFGDAAHAYVGDFGMRGDPAFMSPEQLAGGTCDRRSDVYSLGATLYAALAGHPPFSRPTPEALADAVQNAPAPSLRAIRADIPDALAAGVARCLEKEPAKRFATPRELDAALLRTALEPVAARTAAASASAGDLSVRASRVPQRPNVAIVELKGSVTTGTLAQFQEQIGILRDSGASRLLLDLSEVRFISSGGFGYLITLSDEVRAAGGAIALAGMRKHVELVYESLGLDAFFQVSATREEALRKLAPELESAPPEPVAAPAPAAEASTRSELIDELRRELEQADAERAKLALPRIEMLARADERDAEIHALRGRALCAIGDLGRAELELRRGGETELSEKLAKHRETVVAAWKGTAVPARAEVEAAVAREPHRGEHLHLRALCRRAGGDLLGALQDLNRALELSAGSGEAHVTYALVVRALGDRAEAAAHFERALRLTPPEWPLRPHVTAMAGAAR